MGPDDRKNLIVFLVEVALTKGINTRCLYEDATFLTVRAPILGLGNLVLFSNWGKDEGFVFILSFLISWQVIASPISSPARLSLRLSTEAIRSPCFATTRKNYSVHDLGHSLLATQLFLGESYLIYDSQSVYLRGKGFPSSQLSGEHFHTF